jgi:hypothetical protein
LFASIRRLGAGSIGGGGDAARRGGHRPRRGRRHLAGRQCGWETPEGDKRSVTEIEADEVGASLKWATAKVERASQRGTGERNQGRERQAERGGDFNDAQPTY